VGQGADHVGTRDVAVGTSLGYGTEECWMALPGQPTLRIGLYGSGHDGGKFRASNHVASAANGLTVGPSNLTANGGRNAWLAGGRRVLRRSVNMNSTGHFYATQVTGGKGIRNPSTLV
jgi:hypothetical protein